MELGLIDASAADPVGRQLVDALDSASISYAVFDGERVVGSLRFTYLPEVADPEQLFRKFDYADAVSAFGAEAVCMTSRFIVDEQVRSSRAMLRMMELCYEDGRDRGVRLNYGDTSPGLLLFYEHMGYRRYTRSWNDETYGFKLPIVMLGRDQDWFRRVRSPLLRSSLRLPHDDEARDWFDATHGSVVECESAPFQGVGEFIAGVERLLGRSLADLPELLNGLVHEELEALLARASLFSACDGDRVVRRGEREHGVLVVLSGRLVERGADGRGLLSAGDAFGDVYGQFIGGAGSEVVAETAARLLVLPSGQVEHLLAGDDERLEGLRGRLTQLVGG